MKYIHYKVFSEEWNEDSGLPQRGIVSVRLAQRANVSVAVGFSPRVRCTHNMRHVVVPYIIIKSAQDSTTTWRTGKKYRIPWAEAHGYGHIPPLGLSSPFFIINSVMNQSPLLYGK